MPRCLDCLGFAIDNFRYIVDIFLVPSRNARFTGALSWPDPLGASIRLCHLVESVMPTPVPILILILIIILLLVLILFRLPFVEIVKLIPIAILSLAFAISGLLRCRMILNVIGS